MISDWLSGLLHRREFMFSTAELVQGLVLKIQALGVILVLCGGT